METLTPLEALNFLYELKQTLVTISAPGARERAVLRIGSYSCVGQAYRGTHRGRRGGGAPRLGGKGADVRTPSTRAPPHVSVAVDRGGVAMIQVSGQRLRHRGRVHPDGVYPPRHQQDRARGRPGEPFTPWASAARRWPASWPVCPALSLLTKDRCGRVCLSVPHQRGGRARHRGRRARPVGTTITVRDLFYNTPARMKFLKKDTSEGNYVGRCGHSSLRSGPPGGFVHASCGTERPQFQTPGDGRLPGRGVCRAFA